MTRLIAPITRSIALAARVLLGRTPACTRAPGAALYAVAVVFTAILAGCSTLPVLPPDEPVDPLLLQQATVNAESAAAQIGQHARAALPLMVFVTVTDDVNALIAAMEVWYDALEATYPTSRELTSEALPALHASRAEATQCIARLRTEPIWAYRPLHELMARTLDLSDALIRYQIDRTALSRLPSDRYAQLAEVHNAWRDALLMLQRDLRSGQLQAAFTPPEPAGALPSLRTAPVGAQLPTSSTAVEGEGSAATVRPQSILPDEL